MRHEALKRFDGARTFLYLKGIGPGILTNGAAEGRTAWNQTVLIELHGASIGTSALGTLPDVTLVLQVELHGEVVQALRELQGGLPLLNDGCRILLNIW